MPRRDNYATNKKGGPLRQSQRPVLFVVSFDCALSILDTAAAVSSPAGFRHNKGRPPIKGPARCLFTVSHGTIIPDCHSISRTVLYQESPSLYRSLFGVSGPNVSTRRTSGPLGIIANAVPTHLSLRIPICSEICIVITNALHDKLAIII